MQRILYIQYTNPAAYPPLEHSSRILAEKGWKVLFLGTINPAVDPLRFPPHPNITVKCLPFQPAGWRQKLHYLCFCLWTVWWALGWRPQWVYVSDPIACPAGLLLRVVGGVKMIYHEHDWPSEDFPSVFFRWILWARRRLSRSAQTRIIPNEERAKRFSSELGIGEKVVCVWNCPRKEEVFSERSDRREGLQLLYQGSLVPDRLPMAVLQALATLPEEVRLRIIGYETKGHTGYIQQLQTAAKRLNIPHRVEVLGAMPRWQVFKNSAGCDVGLALLPCRDEEINFRWMVGASNKPFDYLACGMAVLVSRLPDWKKMYVEPGFGLACDPEDPRDIARALQWFLDHPQETQVMGENGRRRILEEWNYEKQFFPVLERMYGKSLQA